MLSLFALHYLVAPVQDLAEEPWAAAERARAANPVYASVPLPDRSGLLPLGVDPASGLLEFAHLASGAPARRDAETGELELTEESGVVLVLVPPGAFDQGAQSTNPDEPAYDPGARHQRGTRDARGARRVPDLEVRADAGAVVEARRGEPQSVPPGSGDHGARDQRAASGRAGQLDGGRRAPGDGRARAPERGPVGVRRASRDDDRLVDRELAGVDRRSVQPRRRLPPRARHRGARVRGPLRRRTGRARARSGATPPTRSACTTRWATSGSGVGTPTRRTATRHGRATACASPRTRTRPSCASGAAAASPVRRASRARRVGSPALRSTRRTTSASGRARALSVVQPERR